MEARERKERGKEGGKEREKEGGREMKGKEKKRRNEAGWNDT